jgi:uncharacterized protein YjiS (DUF1127 family)
MAEPMQFEHGCAAFMSLVAQSVRLHFPLKGRASCRTHGVTRNNAMNHILRKLRTGWQMKSLRRELYGLSDGQLNDLGIHRGQIPDMARYCHGAGPRPDNN